VVEQAARLSGRDVPLPGNEVHEALAIVVEKVARHAYRVTDEDIDAAADAGCDENELFDVIVAAALGAGLARRECGLAAISAWEEAR
jgi:alkylhydroperoxidase family enzyme